MESLPWLNGATFYGECPAPQAERRIAELIEQAGGDWRIDAWATVTRGALAAMQGRIDEGRACSEHGRSLFTDLGLRVELTWSSHFFAYVEILGGDLAAAEAELRQGYEISKEISETGYLSTTAAMLADVVYEQGRYEEALRLTEESEATGAPDDELTQILWRATRAKILARLGDPDAGETLAGAALERVRTTEYLVETADTLRAYAETLRAGGRDAEAAAALREALELYERKGNLVMAGRVRELLAGGDGHR
jgi:ATP/maltotriose-dependent transcriptional regulator MalT